jgi:hypothetical protein
VEVVSVDLLGATIRLVLEAQELQDKEMLVADTEADFSVEQEAVVLARLEAQLFAKALRVVSEHLRFLLGAQQHQQVKMLAELIFMLAAVVAELLIRIKPQQQPMVVAVEVLPQTLFLEQQVLQTLVAEVVVVVRLMVALALQLAAGMAAQEL